MAATYDNDIIAWATEQAALLRAGKFSELDIENIAGAIEDVGKAEQFEFAKQMAALLTFLLQWACQSASRGPNLQAVIGVQRKRLQRRLSKMPSLRPLLVDEDWIADMWGDARDAACKEAGIEYVIFPEQCPWALARALDDTFWPD
ncbi:DUF29 domain-containing protein [Burkholderia sp. Se-20378]|uniref:DUF29 domain-containing protein n=1 Tax=Burkholderia sp. Se-20378 TaxID=2703899 RepID=UPI001980B3AE|nr:DUF29 domain-containing protein [Burkholderia sp. Se-20378]MBN3770721.1 DUF29 domain-containing protein [Burkholderia sp. Se-20378]